MSLAEYIGGGFSSKQAVSKSSWGLFGVHGGRFSGLPGHYGASWEFVVGSGQTPGFGLGLRAYG